MCSHQEPLNEKNKAKNKKSAAFVGSNGFLLYICST
nr:MAG TPA: hypothetical protein [Caudoviricetes sp.]